MASQRIDDHGFWAGSKAKGSVFPEGAKVKEERSMEGTGHMSDYPDTLEAVNRNQEESKRKVHGHSQKPGHRN